MGLEQRNSIDSVFDRRESAVRSYCRAFPTTFSSASGAAMTASDGTRYIDFLAGCSSLNYGHNHPELKQALIDYVAADGIAHGLDMHTDAKAQFLNAFESLILAPRNMDYRVMFPGPTGTNAVEAAMKIARKVTGRSRIVAFTNGFHGMSLGALAATGNADKRLSAGTDLGGVFHEAYDGYFGDGVDTASQLERRLADPSSGLEPPAAILVETVQGEGGLNVAGNDWLRSLEDIARRYGALFIVDDIQAGCGRTGPFFSFERAGVKPDVVTLAKSLSGIGLPMAVTLIKPEHDIWKPGEHNGTFRGNNLAFITAVRALELFWSSDHFSNSVKSKGQYLEQRLNAISDQNSIVVGTKGIGMMRGLLMQSGDLAGKVCKECFDRGLIIETSGSFDEVVKILCPLNISDEELTAGLDILQASVNAIEEQNAQAAA